MNKNLKKNNILTIEIGFVERSKKLKEENSVLDMITFKRVEHTTSLFKKDA